MNSWYKSPDKSELQENIIKIYDSLIKDPSMMNGEWGFINIKFK